MRTPLTLALLVALCGWLASAPAAGQEATAAPKKTARPASFEMRVLVAMERRSTYVVPERKGAPALRIRWQAGSRDSLETAGWSFAEAQRLRALELAKADPKRAKGAPSPDVLPYRLRKDGHDLPIVWYPLHPWAALLELKRAGVDPGGAGSDADRVRRLAENLRQARAGKAGHVREWIVGLWCWEDPEFFAVGRPGFTQRIFRNPRRSTDQAGRPGVVCDVAPSHQAAFHAYTGRHVGKRLPIVVDDVIWIAPTVVQALREAVQITGDFTPAEQEHLLRGLRGTRKPPKKPSPREETDHDEPRTADERLVAVPSTAFPLVDRGMRRPLARPVTEPMESRP